MVVIHCHALCLIDLISLETNFSDSDIYRIRCSFTSFKKGWLHDEVINSYMYMLTQENASNLYCCSTEGMIIASNKDFSTLWFDQNLENIENAIITFNSTNSHCILLLLDINNYELSILYPLGQLYEGSRNFGSYHMLLQEYLMLVRKPSGESHCSMFNKQIPLIVVCCLLLSKGDSVRCIFL